MQWTQIALQASRAADPAGALRALSAALRAEAPLHGAAWVECDPPAVRARDGDAAFELSPELCEVAAHARHAELYPAGTLSRELAAAFPGAEILLVPARHEGSGGALLLAAPAGAFGDDPAPWRLLGETVAGVAARP
ncbi:MAG TPA: hypothetical protein VHG91_20145, partial [Longimicrobium sp.]|nr:hypothetical protein [Longimicrobium sp.]